MQAVAQIHLKSWAVQEREENVESGEVKVNEMIHQVRLWKAVRRVEAEWGTFPLFWPMSKAKGITARSERNTYGFLGPEFWSAVSQCTVVSLVVAIVFGFEVKGGQREICAATLSKKTVIEVKSIERILEWLDPEVLGVGVFIVTWV
jgi:hypothetical protein